MKYKVGFGYDVHRLAEGETLWLGGIEIEHSKGTVAHSDGDVVIHAIADALLGAAGMRDIGFHFPDTSDEFKNIDSKKLLVKVVRLLKERGYKVGNIDCTVAMQTPKLMGFISDMERKLADILNVEKSDVSVKATTTERLGFEGREEGVSVYAVALIYKNEIEDI
jgi:2-C-methyl-D-erythritol 2,4-cyclodiphosphate synthase